MALGELESDVTSDASFRSSVYVKTSAAGVGEVVTSGVYEDCWFNRVNSWSSSFVFGGVTLFRFPRSSQARDTLSVAVGSLLNVRTRPIASRV